MVPTKLGTDGSRVTFVRRSLSGDGRALAVVEVTAMHVTCACRQGRLNLHLPKERAVKTYSD